MTEKEMIREALNKHRDFNANPSTWARFEAVRFPLETRCAVKVGTIHSNGEKESPTETLIWSYRHDIGRCDRTILHHC